MKNSFFPISAPVLSQPFHPSDLDDRWLYFEISDFTFFLHFLLMFLGWIGGLMQWKIISFCTPDSFWWFIIVKLVPKHTACTFKNNTCHVLFCFLFLDICFLKILVDQRNMSYVQVWWKLWWNQRKPNILWLMILTMALYWAFCYDKLGNNWWDKHELHTCIEFCHKRKLDSFFAIKIFHKCFLLHFLHNRLQTDVS